jgi:hypothetical protein
MLSRCLIAFLAVAVTLATGCNHCCRRGCRRPLLRNQSSCCCEPVSCCGYGAPVMHGPVAPVPVPVPVMGAPLPTHHP